MLLNIITEPSQILHKKAGEVSKLELQSSDFKKLMKDLAETMRVREGVGLAAPQVDVSKRLIAIAKEYNTFNSKRELILMNPVWEKASIFKIFGEEGCLSVPGIYGDVKRYKKIKVKAWDENGQEINFIAEDFLARIIQHEVDHLDGVLFISKAKNLHETDKIIKSE